MDLIISLPTILLLSPLFLVIAVLIKLDTKGPIIFRQKRAGQDGQPFTFYKFRSMVANAEELKSHYQKLNEANGPVFKIRNDPRYTKVGKFLSHTGLDELPQLVNILKGDMSLVGPRPLPVDEEKKIPAKWQIIRRSVKPGLTSSWLLSGAHHLTFSQWMDLDIKDIENENVFFPSFILARTVGLGLKLLKNELSSRNRFPF